MAKIDLNVHLENAKRDIAKLEKSGATANVKNSSRDMTELVNEIGSLLKISKPTNEQLRQISRAFKQLDNIIKAVADTVQKVSPELQKVEKEINKANKELDKLRNQQDKLSEKGNRQTGKLRNKYVQEKISGITYAQGQPKAGKQVSIDAFTKNAQKGDFSKYSNPQQAAAVYKNLLEEEANITKEFNATAKAIAATEEKLRNLRAEAERLAITGDTQIHGDASVRTSEVSQAISDTIGQNKELEQNAKNPTVELENFNKQVDKQSTTLGKAFKQFSIYAIALRTVKKALKEAVDTIKDLDKYLTEQAMVTGKTRQQTYKLLSTYQELAKTTGATTREVAEVATQYMRQGKTAEEALTLTQAAVSAAKVAGISTSESVNYLTTALNGFRLSAEDAMQVSDKFASIAAQSATSYEEIATALSKVAAQANLAGMSIDYTTALLAKGIETTREAPETIGTALKTIIARMRELTDYGETLGDGTDINNVESQLAYVGIALRDANGELRSTEDVLNDLGQKWDTLNNNQQAAIAKALAGTRQQSRLIAMMSDYERVIELQNIAERSQGATLAQMSTYMEGMDAALNKINVAWEEIVSNLVNSDAIINIINLVGGFLETLGSFLSTDFGVLTTVTALSVIGLTIVRQKMQEFSINQANQRITIAQQKLELEKQKNISKVTIEKNKELIAQKKVTLEMAKQTLFDKNAGAEEKARAQDIVTRTELEIKELEIQSESAQTFLDNYSTQNALLEQQSNWLNGLTNGWGGLGKSILSVFQAALPGLTTLVAQTKAATIATRQHTAASKANAQQKKIEGQMDAGDSAAKIPYVGWIIWAVIMGGALLSAVASAIGTFGNLTETTTEKINDLSNEIYKLNDKASSINSITDSYDDLDAKLIKTNKDLQEQTELLEKASDLLDEEEKKVYQTMTNSQKRNYLSGVQQQTDWLLARKRSETLNLIRNMSSDERKSFLNSTDSDALTAQSAIFAINNTQLYSVIDERASKLGVAKQATQKLAQSIIEELSVEDAWKLANGELAWSIDDLLDSIDRMIQLTDGGTATISEILNSDDYSLKEQVNAYKEMKIALSDNAEALASFQKLYSEYEIFSSDGMTGQVLDFIDAAGLSIDKINELYSGWKRLQKAGLNISEDSYKNRFGIMLSSLAENGGDIATTIEYVFADYLAAFDKGSKEWIAAWNALVSNFGDLVETGILNMGQSMTSLKNTINNFYEKASNWATMSDSERAEFIADNGEFFSGQSGADLLAAFESGNYTRIAQALASNEQLQERVRQQLAAVEQELKVELAREGADRNEAYIKQLQDYKKFLENQDELFLASLDTRVEQEQKQLSIYKEYLQKQQDALEESLNKRKDAYSKYFDTINQEAETDEYEEQAQTYIANIAKLATSTNGASLQQTKELEQSLEELEKERLKTLRERAQEAMIQDIDDTLSDINNKFDDLLKNNQTLLQALTADMSNKEGFLASVLAANIQGMTANEANQYIQGDFANAFGSILPAGALDKISATAAGDNLILNINGKEINLSEATQFDLYTIIMNALKAQGLR